MESLQDLVVFSHIFVKNVTLALNANAYFEIHNENIQSIRTGIDSIIKMGLLRDGLYSSEKIDGYIDVKSPKDWGRLNVTVLCAHGLVPKDSNGKSDPYAIFGWCTKSRWESIIYKHQTKRIKETLEPEWKEEDNNKKLYQFSEHLSRYQFLKVQLWDHDITSKDDFEGEANIPLSIILSNPAKEITINLTEKSYEEDLLKVDDEDDPTVTGNVTVSWKFKPRRRVLPKILKFASLSKAPSTTSSKSRSNEKSQENIRQNGS